MSPLLTVGLLDSESRGGIEADKQARDGFSRRGKKSVTRDKLPVLEPYPGRSFVEPNGGLQSIDKLLLDKLEIGLVWHGMA